MTPAAMRALGTGAQRLGTAMKSNASAGFNSKPDKTRERAAITKPVEEQKQQTPEDQLKEMEEEVHRLLEDSAKCKV